MKSSQPSSGPLPPGNIAAIPDRGSSPRSRLRLLLGIGFGGLLTLLLLTGISALSVIREVQIQNEKIRNDYVQRAQVLEQLRSDIYLSGTYVRDFLLESDPERAEVYRQEFARTRQRIEQAVARYSRLLRPEERVVFHSLTEGMSEYFEALQPALGWNAEQRIRLGRPFMRDEVLRRRTTMINLAGKAGEVNQHQLEAGNASVQELFVQFRRRLLLLLMLTLSVGLLLASISMQRLLKLEGEAGQRYREMAQARREAQDLSAKLVDAQEEERRRVARELHDEVGQSLSALLVGIGNLSKVVPSEGNIQVREQMDLIRTLAEKSVSVIRNMSLLLRPSMLDDLGLIPALQWQAREVSRATGMRVSVAAEEIPENLPDEYKTCIYRIVQEALHNCQRHSQAHRVRIQLQQTSEHLLLSIQDDGRGFQPRHRGLGLLGIEERVHRLNGQFLIHSEEGNGTLLS
ncbi:MAG: histidine kinase, partial [Bryobacteraceae bacterium]